jgi:ligand-binding SRPBCC domain-containing protein
LRTSSLVTEQLLPCRLDDVFPFFAEARNLERITPPWLRFEVLTPDPIEMRAGTLIRYRLRWRGVPLRWRTEIETWEPPHRFVDRQVRGPYLLWRHEHRFVEKGGQTLAHDRVDYAAPGGRLAHRLIVDRDVQRIFSYRRLALESIFGTGLAGELPSEKV